METKVLQLVEIKAAAYNPSKDLQPGDAEYERLKNSITEFGFVEPIIVNQRNMTLVGGHQRYKILQELGKTETEAVVVDLDANEEKTLNIALNKIEGDWDTGKLQELLQELAPEDVMRTSFNEFEIKDILRELDSVAQETGAQLATESDGEEKEQGTLDKPEETSAKGFEIYLSFTTQEAAENWLASHGINQTFSDNRSIVLSMGEASASAVG